MNKILVLGKGYLGTEFERHGFNVWGRDKFDAGKSPKDIDNKQLENIIEHADVVVNCIGKSNTRWCEDKNNFKEALYINGKLPNILSSLCNRNNKKFVHISTGCLYDDTTKDNKETDFISAHCNYTITKWVGEQGCNHQTDLILRPRLYFSDIKNKNNLLCKLPNFNTYTGDQCDSITSTSTIVGATKELILAKQCGIFNVAQIGSATIARIAIWCGLDIIGINTAKQLRERENLYLVNNVMNIDKLLKFYTPIDIETAITVSYGELNEII